MRVCVCVYRRSTRTQPHRSLVWTNSSAHNKCSTVLWLLYLWAHWAHSQSRSESEGKLLHFSFASSTSTPLPLAHAHFNHNNTTFAKRAGIGMMECHPNIYTCVSCAWVGGARCKCERWAASEIRIPGIVTSHVNQLEKTRENLVKRSHVIVSFCVTLVRIFHFIFTISYFLVRIRAIAADSTTINSIALQRQRERGYGKIMVYATATLKYYYATIDNHFAKL